MRALETLYYQDRDGNVLPGNDVGEPPEGARYQVYQNPAALITQYVDLEHRGKGSPVFARAETGYSPDLVLAMVRPDAAEKKAQRDRYGSHAPALDFRAAVLMAALSCERCGNALAHRYGLAWGYREHSKEWYRTNTSCERCQDSHAH